MLTIDHPKRAAQGLYTSALMSYPGLVDTFSENLLDLVFVSTALPDIDAFPEWMIAR